jgi:hypothetical protein
MTNRIVKIGQVASIICINFFTAGLILLQQTYICNAELLQHLNCFQSSIKIHEKAVCSYRDWFS